MELGTIGALTEVAALRAILSAWITASVVHNPQGAAYVQVMEKYSQLELQGLTLTALENQDIVTIKEGAAVRVSEFFSAISLAIKEGPIYE